ncbi:helix-turn-helix domain-containing protein [Streptococcus sanguinis]|uniref:helix-turn-helix domain-containing protein n=1 Tax=Streptococcus sanguinis TaxID=1305 RepID=UPI001CBD22C5|nr:helix-turn-helix transcriptional regulator [Streptococcus sanguinis]MBZ2022146.1 helix-turn-helix domain-containing protein [Streptococcus sanguinis]MBZ2073764.1 helix-turn-helix domain-containing protein [Streptococcus sanguinis]MBZ2081687.1 helix-turn-helix domain-containing protein [Streptococcus sanguinis]MCC3165768.1 helix-turn-helix family protein [Streptococcus sanguinis]
MFSERLKEQRKQAKLTQKEIAAQIGVSQQAYQKWEKGDKKPTQDKLTKIAELFDVSIDYLLGATDDPRTQAEIDIDEAIENSVSYDGKPITDNDREIIKTFLKEYFHGK